MSLEKLGSWIKVPDKVDSCTDLFPSKGRGHLEVLEGEGKIKSVPGCSLEHSVGDR